ncbi:HNH endonuclease [Rodentibacter trehalosifermentans]|uniref:HNH endonuclease n=2 Tax=Rodentibacter trehalosifermentans TaxID=1908263 RepID=A0A1V3J3E4_9PAST|nr:HNH endonuclease [Rodentibacter trehalosifermentans]
MKLKINTILTNQELMDIFKCANSGGMRRSHRTNSLVIIFDHTKHLYDDCWKDGILHYTGMGKNGDQSLDFQQNKTLAASRTNGVEVHLFEVFKHKEYTYMGQVYLVGEPYQAKQKGEDKLDRNVWVFPLKKK